MLSDSPLGNAMRIAAFAAAAFMMALGVRGAEPRVVRPFETGWRAAPSNPIDVLVLSALRERAIQPANLCSDEVFIRRVYLDVLGTLPVPNEIRRFLQDRRPRKRALLIDRLLEREEFAEYWALKWGDLLRVKSEYPINLWPNAVQAYHRWIRDAIREKMPYDQFVRELLTSSGSNFRVPPVNFYRAIQGRDAPAIARAVALTFMGVRVEHWPDSRRKGMEDIFSRVAYKSTAEWKEEIVFLDPAPAEALHAVFPDGVALRIPADEDPRHLFAAWLTSPDNPWFARNIVNRVWAWLLGRGIVHEADDFRPDNPPAIPELLAHLERELVRADYDLLQIYRLILNSQTYQRSSIPGSDHPEAEKLFAHYPVRRLDAEVLIDALSWILGPRESYASAIPEPFTFIPNYQRTISLGDGSISSPFLDLFGRPPRDTGFESERNNEPTDRQRLHLLNSTHIQGKIQNSWRLRRLTNVAKKNPQNAIQTIYLLVLSRRPTPAEVDAVEDYAKTMELNTRQAVDDLVWALINSKEFLFRH